MVAKTKMKDEDGTTKIHGIRYFSEPALFLYSFAYMLQSPIVHQYIYSRFSEEERFDYRYNNSTGTSQECRYNVMDAIDIEAQQRVQSLTAHFLIYYHMINIIPSIIMNLFYGALSDHIGRRCMMTLVLICAVIESSVILVNMMFKLPLWTIFFGNACAGIGGGLNGMFMLIIAYTADVTEIVDRSIRIENTIFELGLIEASIFLGMTLSNFASGEFIQNYGFPVSQTVVILSYLTAITYIAFVLKKSRDLKKHVDFNTCGSFHRQPINMWNTFFKERENNFMLYLAIVILICGLTFIVSVHSVFTLYLLNRPFCWLATDIGYIMGTCFLFLAVGTVFGMKIGIRYLPEWFMCMLSYILSAGSFIYIAFASKKIDLYGAIAIRIFGGLPTAIFRGNISKSVEKGEQGAVFSAITSIEMLMIMIGMYSFNTSYAYLNKIGHPGWFFFIPAALLIIPFLLAMVYWKKYIELNKLEKEEEDCKHGEENEQKRELLQQDENDDEED